MGPIVAGLALIAVALLALVLQRLYSFVPPRELKRLARRHDQLAQALYKPVAYGASLRLLLWVIAGGAMAGGIVLTVSRLNPSVSLALLISVLALAFVVIPSMRLGTHNTWLPVSMAGPLVWVLGHLYRPLHWTTEHVNAYRYVEHHSRLYEKQDLLQLLERQADLPGNRITKRELELATRALHFDTKTAHDILIPRHDMYLVNADESIGPILLDALHKHGQRSYLVYQGKPEKIIGVLRMKDAIAAKEGGRVIDFVRPELTQVSEGLPLSQLLGVFQQTEQKVLIVLNEFEEFVGSITFDNLVDALMGEEKSEDDHAEAVTSSPQATEVVE